MCRISPPDSGSFRGQLRLVATAVSVTLLLSACGGGGGGGAAPAAPGAPGAPATPAAPAVALAAEGGWSGKTAGGVEFAFLVLENAETWSVSIGSDMGLLSGKTVVDGSAATITGTSFSAGKGAISTAAGFTATVVPKTSLNGVLTGGSTALSTKYDVGYDETPPSLATTAGTYAGVVGTLKTAPTTFNLTLSATGAITASAGACSITGNAKGRPSGKAVFDVTLALAGTCDFSSATGVMVFDLKNKGTIFMAMNPAKSDGMVFIGNKP